MQSKSKKYTGVYQNTLANGDVSFYFTYKDLEKKKKWVKVGLKSEDVREIDAHHKRQETINLMRMGEEPKFITERRQDKKLTLDDIAEKYFKFLQAKDKTKNKRNTKETLGKYNNRISPEFGSMAIADLKKKHVIDFLDTLKDEDLKDATVNNYHSILKSIINYGINNFDELENLANISSKIPLLKLDNIRQRILTIDEMIKVLSFLENKPKAYLFFGFLMQTGARPQAILSLKKVNVNLANGILMIQGLKKGMTYQATISGKILDLLTVRLAKLENNHYIFHPDNPKTKPEKQISYQSMRNQIQPVLDKMFNTAIETSDRIHKVTFYTIRHSFATHLAQNPAVSVFDIKNLMGHNSLKMTERYAKTSLQEGTKKAIVDLFGIEST